MTTDFEEENVHYRNAAIDVNTQLKNWAKIH